MTADPDTSGIRAVATVTEANAGILLTEQPTAVAAFSSELTADEDDWFEAFSDEPGQTSSAYFRERKAKRDTLPDKLKKRSPLSCRTWRRSSPSCLRSTRIRCRRASPRVSVSLSRSSPDACPPSPSA